MVDEELLLFGGRHSLGWRAGQGGAFTLLYQAAKKQDVDLDDVVPQIRKRTGCTDLINANISHFKLGPRRHFKLYYVFETL